jgi:hypothetical protein
MVGEVFDLADARVAFERTMSREKHGKVVLRTKARHDDTTEADVGVDGEVE